jgi:hypothetical protein
LINTLIDFGQKIKITSFGKEMSRRWAIKAIVRIGETSMRMKRK